MENSRPQPETWNETYSGSTPQYSQDNKRILTGVLAILWVTLVFINLFWVTIQRELLF